MPFWSSHNYRTTETCFLRNADCIRCNKSPNTQYISYTKFPHPHAVVIRVPYGFLFAVENKRRCLAGCSHCSLQCSKCLLSGRFRASGKPWRLWSTNGPWRMLKRNSCVRIWTSEDSLAKNYSENNHVLISAWLQTTFWYETVLRILQSAIS